MQLIVTGVREQTSAVEVRERLAFDSAGLGHALAALQTTCQEAVILSTCNRVEIYAVVDSLVEGDAALRQFLASWHHLEPAWIAPHLASQTGTAAVRHLFRLAAGLESMVLGEDQILSQIKGALAAAQQAAGAGPRLNRLFHSAISAGKRVRTSTGIARNHLSVVSVALDLARERRGPLANARVLLIGAGRIAELATKHFRREHPAALTIMNRRYDRAAELATSCHGAARPIAELPAALAETDLLLSCTSAPTTILDAATVAAARANVSTPLLIFDLAVPHDIDRSVATLPGIELIDVDGLRAICDLNRAARSAEVGRADAMVEEEVDQFMGWWATQRVVPTIRALRARAEAIQEAEVNRVLAQLPDLSEREQAAIRALSAGIVNKLLHQPITSLKDPVAGDELAAAARRLFRLADPA